MLVPQIWIVDFGSQYTQLITRKSRELGYSSFIYTPEEVQVELKKSRPKALILSGGPQSIFNDQNDYAYLFEHSLPILGVCYGMQLMGQFFGGKVEKGVLGEYGANQVEMIDPLFSNVGKVRTWMSHSDHVVHVPKDFKVIMTSDNDLIAGMKHETLPLMAFQFHPEVEHTESGREILKVFFTHIAKLEKDWGQSQMLKEAQDLVQKVSRSNVLCAFSGGVDSLVAASLAHPILQDRLYCFFVDNGLLRPQDYGHIETLRAETPLNIEVLDAKEVFYRALKGVDDPEQKRKIIGKIFIEVFEQKVHEFERDHGLHFDYLLQGTLYPDVIESTSPHKKGGKSVTIKSHHNVGGLPERMKLKLLEPLKWMFKDEVRAIGNELNLNPAWVHRHPFPGPGLGVRILGEVTPERILMVQKSDQILLEEMQKFDVYKDIWQAFTVHLPVKTVGVKGDARAYEEVICLRLVHSTDGMTATWADVPRAFLDKVSTRINNEVKGITRVVYDITSKPPGTIEWE